MIYLMQHGEAESDGARPLTAEGRAHVEEVARRAAAAGLRVATVLHSDKLRAQETAAILGAALQAPLEERQDLAPNDDPAPLAAWLRERAEPVAVVGHLPHLERLLALLGPTGVAFRNAALLCVHDGKLQWGLWPEPPKLLKP